MVSFAVLAVMWAATFVLGELLRPSLKQHMKPGKVDPPTAEQGKPIPVVFGTCKVSCNVTWFGSPASTEVREKQRTGIFRRQWVTIGHKYSVPMQVTLCYGCVDELIDIYWGDYRLSQYNGGYLVWDGNFWPPKFKFVGTPATTPALPLSRFDVSQEPTEVVVNAPNLFGGTSFEGGVEGPLDFFWGTETQPYSDFIAETSAWDFVYFPTPVSPLKNVSHVVFKDTIMGMSPYLKPTYFVIRRCPSQVSCDEEISNVLGDANPSEVIYEILTDTLWGLAVPSNFINKASFLDAANRFKDEGTGYSFTFTEQTSGADMLQDVLRHANSVLYEDPFTGDLTLKLIRDDYDADALPVMDETTISGLEFSRSSWRETTNEIKLTYTSRDDEFQAAVRQAHNLASVQAIGEVRSLAVDYAGITRIEQAQKQAEDLLRLESIPLAKASFKTGRSAAGLRVGDPFALRYPAADIDQLVMRVVKIDYGRLEKGEIGITAVEDAFDVSGTAYAPPLPPRDDEERPPAPITTQLIRELPYAISGASHELGVMAARPLGIYQGYEVWSDSEQVGTQAAFTPFGRLNDLSIWDTENPGSCVIYSTRDESEIPSSGLMLFYAAFTYPTEEFFGYSGVESLGEGRFRLGNLHRGLFDTAPTIHFQNHTQVWFVEPGLFHETDVGYSLNDTPTIRLLPFNSLGTLLFGSAIPVPVTIKGRSIAPLPPGNVKINGVPFWDWPDWYAADPLTLLVGNSDVVLTWSHRNRVEQGSVWVHQGEAGSFTLEGTLRVEAYVWNSTTWDYDLKRTWDGQTGTTITWTAAQFLGDNPDNERCYFNIVPVGTVEGLPRWTPRFKR
jgi:hypothetical protein